MKQILSTILLTISLGFHSAEAVTFKMATLAPNGSTWMNEIQAATDKISAQTEGRVKFKFYTGGVMGSASSVLKKIRINQLHGGAFTSGELSEIYPDIQIYALPFMFRSYAEVDYVRSKMDEAIQAGMEKQGMILLGISGGGFAYIMSDTPISAVDQLRNKKVWLPEGDAIIQTVFKTIGMAPVSLSLADVYTGLQTGMIDTIGTSAMGAIAFQWHTRVKYVSDIPLIYLTGNLVIDEKAFKKISASDQRIVRSIMLDTMHKLGKINRQNDEQARLALQKQGIQFVSISKQEWQRSQEVAKQSIDELGKQGIFTEAMYKLLLTNLSDYRQQHGTSANASQ
jgi:TRAP-type C4-dicarboxylate transport system substrate-binding protein